jgi:tRNA threonylcarbamoyladenosine biosynthesis protein TsaB
MNILAIDTSSSWLTIVCGDQDGIKGQFFQNIGNQHAEKLAGIVESLLQDSGLKFSDIDLAGVVTGPGSFTGLRVGISFVKGLAMALNIKTMGLNTLDALAHEASGHNAKRISPMIDARKGQVYAALYNVEQGAPALTSEYVATAPSDWLKDLPKDTLVLGSGVETYRDLIASDFKQVALLEKNHITISPEILFESALKAFNAGKLLDPEELDAFYIRQADAVCKPSRP